MEIIDSENINEARKKIDKLFQTGNEIVVIAKDSDFNRKILENKKVNVLLFSNFLGNKNRLKQRDSGLNHILAKIARDNNIAIGIDIESIRKTEGKERGKLLARIKQNIKLCKKYKVPVMLCSFASSREEMRSAKDLQAFGRVLGF